MKQKMTDLKKEIHKFTNIVEDFNNSIYQSIEN